MELKAKNGTAEVRQNGRLVGYVTNENGNLRAGGPYFVRGANLTYAEETARFATIREAAEALVATAADRGL